MRLKKDWEDKIEKTRLKRLRRQDWKDKIEKIEKTRLRRKIEERLHQSYQSSSIYINLHQSEKYK